MKTFFSKLNLGNQTNTGIAELKHNSIQNVWTEEELDIIRSTKSIKKLKELLPNRTEGAIRVRMSIVKRADNESKVNKTWRKTKIKSWTSSELKLLVENMHCDINDICKLFPRRTKSSVAGKLHKVRNSGKYSVEVKELVQDSSIKNNILFSKKLSMLNMDATGLIEVEYSALKNEDTKLVINYDNVKDNQEDLDILIDMLKQIRG